MKLTYREWEHLIQLVQAELDNKDTPPNIKLLDISILQELECRKMGLEGFGPLFFCSASSKPHKRIK